MPLIAPILDLIIGLTLRLLVWLVVATARLVARFVWSAITNHPGLTFLGLKVAEREGWIVSPYTPFVLAGLGVLAVVRFFTSHPPAQIVRKAREEAKKAYEAGAAIHDGGSKARTWVADRFRHRKDDGPSGNAADFTGFPDPPRPAAANEPAGWNHQAAGDETPVPDAPGKADLGDELDVRVDEIPDHLDVTEVHPEPDAAGDEPLVTTSSNGEMP